MFGSLLLLLIAADDDVGVAVGVVCGGGADLLRDQNSKHVEGNYGTLHYLGSFLLG